MNEMAECSTLGFAVICFFVGAFCGYIARRLNEEVDGKITEAEKEFDGDGT